MITHVSCYPTSQDIIAAPKQKLLFHIWIERKFKLFTAEKLFLFIQEKDFSELNFLTAEKELSSCL